MGAAYHNLRMREKESKLEKTNVGAMRKRRETMTDGKRYIVYYTFETAEKTPEKTPEKKEEKENV